MDLLDRLLGHDAWTTEQLLLICRELSDVQLDRQFDIAHQTVRATLVHMIYNIEAWTDLMAGQSIRKNQARSVDELTDRLDRATSDLTIAAEAVAMREAWDDRWIDPTDGEQRTYGGTIAHVITHNMHHRAQLLYMLRMLGVEDLPEGDVLSWEQQAGST